MAARKTWTVWKASEETFLRQNYAEKGGVWCAEQLKRPYKAVLARAQALDLRRAGYQPKPASVDTPFFNEAVRRAYQQPLGSGAIARLAAQYGVSREFVSRRALHIGARPETRGRPWSEREIELLRQNAQASNDQMVKIMAAKGFKRTACSIKAARVAHDVDRTDSELHTLYDVARLLGVDQSTPHLWVKRGLLIPEEGTGGADGRAKISDLEIARFIVTNPLSINMPKLEGTKEWFIDLLVRKGALAAMSKPKSQREAILQAARAHPTMSRRQIADLLEMDAKIVTVTMSQLKAEGLLTDTREAA
jgi:hypothetical protein